MQCLAQQKSDSTSSGNWDFEATVYIASLITLCYITDFCKQKLSFVLDSTLELSLSPLMLLLFMISTLASFILHLIQPPHFSFSLSFYVSSHHLDTIFVNQPLLIPSHLPPPALLTLTPASPHTPHPLTPHSSPSPTLFPLTPSVTAEVPSKGCTDIAICNDYKLIACCRIKCLLLKIKHKSGQGHME